MNNYWCQHKGQPIVSLCKSQVIDNEPDYWQSFIIDPSLSKHTIPFINGLKEYIF